MAGILAYGSYVPPGRLDRTDIAATLAQPAGRGTRSVASHDEDSTTLAVEAARVALRRAPEGARPQTLLLSTATPTYLDHTNAAVVHAALDLEPAVSAYDFGGAPRSALGALRSALSSSETTLVVASDIRTGLPGSGDESAGGDAAAAFLVGDGPAVAELVGSAAATTELLDRWRVPGQSYSRQWEERFGQASYLPLAQQVVDEVLKASAVTREDVTRVVVGGLHERACATVAKSLGATSQLSQVVGNPGTAQPGLLLAEALDTAAAGDLVLLVTLADGADALLLRATDRLEQARTWSPLHETVTRDARPVPYATFLTWRGMLRREPPRRPDPEPPAPPVSTRHLPWKFAFVAGACPSCGARHLPPLQTCMSCGFAGEMEPVRLADTRGTVATYTVDRLTYSLSPPVVAVVIDFDGGGRFQCELTDADAAAVAIGDRVEMTFRRFFQADNGIANYFWKARPVTGEDG